MDIMPFVTFMIAVLEISLLIAILIGSRDYSSRVFAALVSAHFFWIISHSLIHSFYPGTTNFMVTIANHYALVNINDLVLIFVSLSHFIIGVVSTIFFYFTKTFPENKRPSFFVFTSIFALQVVMFSLYFMSHSIIGGVTFVGDTQSWEWSYGSLGFLFDAFFILFCIGGLYTLYKKSIATTGTVRKNLRYMLWSMMFSIIPVVLVNVILPRLGVYSFDWTGPIAGIGWVILISYSIIKFKQMNIHTVFAKVFVLTISLVLFTNIFISSVTKDMNTALETVIKTLVFVAFIGIGYLLVTNIFKESERKEQEGLLNQKLKSLNEELGEKIVERTKELADSKAHSETILENLPLGVIEYNENFMILRINRTAELFLGVERKAILNNPFKPKDKEVKELSSLATVLYPALSEEGRKVNAREELEKDISKNEVTVTYPRKRELQIITVSIRDMRVSKNLRFVKLFRDVTHEKMVDRSKSEFIKIAAHQLRTPLSGTKWALRTILDRDIGDISKNQEDLLQKIYDSNESLIDIVNDFLSVIHFEEDFGYHMTENDIVESIKYTVLSSLLLAKEKDIEILFKKTVSNIEPFLFDRIKVILSLKNIIGNAIDYAQNSGKITISLKQEGKDALIEIVDTEIGIPKEELDAIFNKFYQVKNIIKISPDQAELGFTISKEIIQKHGGSISVQSEEGKGIIVQIRLPLQR